MKTGTVVPAGALCLLLAPDLLSQPVGDFSSADLTQGALRVEEGNGSVVECPLRHTDVTATISGFVARVKVVQRFVNPWPEPIEAVYVFPLPHGAAVDDLTMVVGSRRIVGVIKRRDEARAVYERALREGRTASLLEQERPNVFTQTVGNIPPREEVRIEISYVDVLPYDRGAYEFHFPMVVGPRYVPGAPLARAPSGQGWAPDTTTVPDASRVTPPVLRPGQRSGHDVTLSVRLDAGVKVRDVRVVSHEAVVVRRGPSRAAATLSPAESIPNKDFVLRYAVAGPKPELALLAHAPRGEDGYFLLMVEPREMEEELKEAPPREVCFLVDVSGSMSGAPSAKVVETTRLLLGRIRPEDRLQVVTFASETQSLFPGYVPATPANVALALRFTEGLAGRGGTEMLPGIRAVLAHPVAADHVRVVVMLTDGFIGNEAEIIREVARRSGDQIRFWAIGVGTSVNRYLIDGIGRQGGMSAVLGLREDPAALVTKIAERLRRAQLARIDIDWGGHAVYETYPARIPDLWGVSPVVVVGRYRSNGPGTLRVSGRAEGRNVSFSLAVDLPVAAEDHAVLTKIWARRKIEDLSEQAIVTRADLADEITDLSLRYRLMSAYTSFVAVDESEQARLLSAPRPPRRVAVPVPIPEGVRYEGIFGEADAFEEATGEMVERARFRNSPVRVGGALARPALPPPAATPALPTVAARAAPAPAPGYVPSANTLSAGVEGNVSGGVVGGVLGGVVGGGGGSPLLVTPAPSQAGPPMAYLHMSASEMQELQARRERLRRGASWSGERATRRQAEGAKALAEARGLLSKEDLGGARRALRRSWLIADALRSTNPWAGQQARADVVTVWKDLEAKHDEAGLHALPGLGKTVGLVVRNAGLSEALASLATASSVTLRVEPGSFEDAGASQRRAALRVAYLDLRGVTVAQALTRLVGPLGLDWQVEGTSVTVASSRRLPGVSVWVYDATGLAAGTEDEALNAERALREAAGVGVELLDPERLLVEGSPAVHARAADALDRLANAAERRERLRLSDLNRAAVAMRDFSWSLLAASLRGETDGEAVAELAEAWRTPGLAEGMEAVSLALPARSAWTIARARAAVPNDAALASLARDAFGVLEQALGGRGATAPDSFTAEVYLALLRAEPSVPATLVRALPGREAILARKEAAASFVALAASLLGRGAPEAVGRVLEEGVLRGDDWTVLAAWALHQAGGEPWHRFRESKADLLAGTGISGAALGVVNRLEAVRPASKLAGASRNP